MKKLFFMLLAFPLVFSACGSDDDDNTITLKQREVSLNVRESHKIEATTSEAGGLKFSTNNAFIATASANGVVYGNKVGEAEILLSDGKSTEKFKVMVTTKNTVCPDPFLTFGASKKDVIAKMGKPSEEEATALFYNNFAPNTAGVIYQFGEQNKLQSSLIFVNANVSVDNLKAHLDDRYTYLGFEDNIALYSNNSTYDNSSMAIGLTVNESLQTYMLVYVPIDHRATKRSAGASQLSTAKEMHEAIKLAK